MVTILNAGFESGYATNWSNAYNGVGMSLGNNGSWYTEGTNSAFVRMAVEATRANHDYIYLTQNITTDGIFTLKFDWNIDSAPGIYGYNIVVYMNNVCYFFEDINSLINGQTDVTVFIDTQPGTHTLKIGLYCIVNSSTTTARISFDNLRIIEEISDRSTTNSLLRANDVYVNENNPTASYTTDSILQIRGYTGHRIRAYMRWDISAYNVSQISAAYIYLRKQNVALNAITVLYERTTSAWTAPTWNTMPTTTSTNSITKAFPNDGNTNPYHIRLDITNMIKDETTNYFGVQCKDNSEGIDKQLTWASGEMSTYRRDIRPRLVLIFPNKYVDIATGSDSDNGNSWVNAYQTIKKGIDNIPAERAIHIAEGDYSAQAAIDLNKNLELVCEDYGGGNASPPLTIILPPTA